MSHAISETDNFDSAVITPDVLDTTYPATVPVGLTALANRTRWHENTLQGASDGSTESVAETNGGVFPVANESTSILLPASGRANAIRLGMMNIVSKVRGLRVSLGAYAWGATQHFMNVPIEPVCEHDGTGLVEMPGTAWKPDISSSLITWVQQTTPVAQPILIWYIKGLPPTGTINQIACQLQAAAGHSALPSSMPKLQLYRYRITDTPTPELVTEVTDTSVNTTAYQAVHSINNSSFTESIQVNARYYLMFLGETGTNSLTTLHLIASQISITTST